MIIARLSAGLLVSACLAAAAIPALADEAADKAELKSVADWARTVTGTFCDYPGFSEGGNPDGDNLIHRFDYRYSYETEADPARQGVLYQLHCMSGAYNSVSVFIMRNDFGDLQLMHVAVPVFDIRYQDPDMMTKLDGAPNVVSYRAQYGIVEASFDPKTLTLTEYSRWRGLGDAWSMGEWKLVDGDFRLQSYTIDPVYNLNKPDANPETDPDDPSEAIKVFP